MPFFGTEFFNAVEGYPDVVALAYIRALWHYYNHTHCEGLPNESDYLQRICHCADMHWARTKGIIFDNKRFFTLNGDGLWHQKRAKELHEHETKLYKMRVEYARKARDARFVNSVINSPDNRPALTPAGIVVCDKERDRVEKEMKSIAGTYSSHQTWAADDRARYRELSKRLKELREILGVKV